ncbi:MAG: PaaI family thioesterase [Caulobacter sp.]|nr:PaaI family thioesterase [Caulobacter sp.]
MTDATTMLYLCRACQRLGACRLGLTEEVLDPEGVMHAKLSCSRDHEAGLNIAHGGWTAAVMDDLLGHLGATEGVLAVTASLAVEFLRPVPIERALEARAWVATVEGGRRLHKAEIRLAATGAILVRGEGVFVERDPAHYERHRRWLANQDAGSDTP